MRPGRALTKRIFIAFRLPASVIEALAMLQHDAIAQISNLSNLRLTPPAQLHVTAVFLGSTPAAEVQAVADLTRHAVHNARRPRFRVDRYHETARVGMVTLREEPVGRHPYGVARGHAREGAPGDAWKSAGVPETSSGRANELTGHLMLALEASGRYVRDYRTWRPHVTIARFRIPPRLKLEPPPVPPFAPTDVALYESELAPSGSTYTVLDVFPFRDDARA